MNQDDRREYLIEELLKEEPQYARMRVPENAGEQKRLLRSLMNIRPPRPVSDKVLEIQDEYLREEAAGTLTKTHCRQLADCYRSCLELAADKGLKSIAFCCISTGEFHFPREKAAEIAVQTVADFLRTDERLERVVFNVFKQEDYDIYRELLG